jgi:hypothetical protein
MASSSDPDAVEAQLEWEEFDPGRGVSFRQHMMAGSCAGVAEHLLMFPVDTYKVRPRPLPPRRVPSVHRRATRPRRVPHVEQACQRTAAISL